MTQPPSLRTTGTESSTVVRNMVTIGLETRHTALMGENHPKSMQFELLWDMESFKIGYYTTPGGRSVFIQFRDFPISCTSVDITVYHYGKMVYLTNIKHFPC